MDAPVILLVPHTWHLEPKEWTAITPLPPPLAVTSSERRVISPRTSFALIHEDSQRVQGSVEETALWLQQATTAQSVTLILPPSVEPSRLLSCLPASSPLLCVQWFLIIMTHLQQQLKQDQEDQTGLYNSEKKRLVERLAEQQVAAAGGVKV